MKTTLNKIKAFEPCKDGWLKLLTFLNKKEADDEELSLLIILESNGLYDAVWALQAVEGFEKEKRLMACDFAESVLHLANDERCVNAIKVARNYANGLATIEELKTACAAASAASSAAASAAARSAARSAACAAARSAAWYAASAAAWYTASDAAWYAASDAAWYAARAAAWYAANKAAKAAAAAAAGVGTLRAVCLEQEKQISIFKKYM
jgi:hypothetical protein